MMNKTYFIFLIVGLLSCNNQKSPTNDSFNRNSFRQSILIKDSCKNISIDSLYYGMPKKEFESFCCAHKSKIKIGDYAFNIKGSLVNESLLGIKLRLSYDTTHSKSSKNEAFVRKERMPGGNSIIPHVISYLESRYGLANRYNKGAWEHDETYFEGADWNLPSKQIRLYSIVMDDFDLDSNNNLVVHCLVIIDIVFGKTVNINNPVTKLQ